MGLLSDVYSSLAITSKENLEKDFLNQLVPLPGAIIKAPRIGILRFRREKDVEKDSKDIIGQDSSTDEILLAVMELQALLAREELSKENTEALAVIANINLGCAYARLGRYREAEEAFNKIIQEVDQKKIAKESIAEQAANHNLEIVATLKNL